VTREAWGLGTDNDSKQTGTAFTGLSGIAAPVCDRADGDVGSGAHEGEQHVAEHVDGPRKERRARCERHAEPTRRRLLKGNSAEGDGTAGGHAFGRTAEQRRVSSRVNRKVLFCFVLLFHTLLARKRQNYYCTESFMFY